MPAKKYYEHRGEQKTLSELSREHGINRATLYARVVLSGLSVADALNKPVTSGAKGKDITEERFGDLVALHPTEKRKNGKVVWVCRCDCGEKTEANVAMLRSGHKKSCGCRQRKWAIEAGKYYGAKYGRGLGGK